MFSEELGGNTNRRRQEEARARQRKLKQEQQRKEQQQAKAAASASATNNPPADTPAETSAPDPSPFISSTPVLTETASAVANALQQRQLRQQVQQNKKALITIQSFYRAHRSNSKLLKQQSALLAKRLQDVSTLRVLLKQTEYVPPPATATSLLLQLLFLSKTIPYKRRSGMFCTHSSQMVKPRDDPKILQQLLETVILPGLYSPDENMNPFVVWSQTRQGQSRLETLLRLSLVTVTATSVDPKVLDTIITFLRGVLVTEQVAVPPTVIQNCRALLLSISPPCAVFPAPSGSPSSTSSSARIMLHARMGSQMDVVSILRHHLLFNTGGTHPIPPESQKLREACIPAKQREQADALYQLTLTAIIKAPTESERRHLYIRFVSEILTVPLLTWKILAASTSKLLVPADIVSSTSSATSQRPMILVAMIQAFVEQYKTILTAGNIDSLLADDTPLITCPATPTQSLLANLIQISRTSSLLNGSDQSLLDYESTTLLFQFVATLVDAVPLGTFSSRESVVEWISDGRGHHSPVVLSSVVMEQCKLLLVDAFVRKLFYCAIDEQALNTSQVLKVKNEKDLKCEKDLQAAGSSAANLAANEARIDRSRGWLSSVWASKLTKGVSKMLAGDNNDKAEGQKNNRKLQESKNESSSLKGHVPRASYTPDLLIALCRVYGIVLARWGGGGGHDIIKRVDHGPMMKLDEKGAKQEVALRTADPCSTTLLNVFCFSTNVIQAAWGIIQSDSAVVSDLYSVIDPSRGSVPVRCLTVRPSYGGKDKRMKNDGAALLYVFVKAIAHALIITDDTEIHDMERPLPLHQLRRCIQTLKQLLYRASCVDDAFRAENSQGGTRMESNYFGLALVQASSRTMRDLYDRSSRRPLCVPKLWLVEGLMENDIRRCKTHDQYVALLSAPVFRVCPFLVSFKRRLVLFDRIVHTSRVEIQGENNQNPFNTNPLKPGIPVRIMRNRVLEDGLATMNNLGRNMRQRIAVQFVNEAGTRESGADAGGLFKEFWTDLCAIAFDPNYGLFRVTEDAGNNMYPSPSSGTAHGPDHIVLFEFLGRILGKALYENITVRPTFAHFFLSFLRGDYNFLHMLPDLSTIDAQLYNNLMFLKTYDGDAEDLCLTFTVTKAEFGGNTEVQLIRNGADTPVMNTNKQRYIGTLPSPVWTCRCVHASLIFLSFFLFRSCGEVLRRGPCKRTV
jgi:hypothetical protein